MKKLLIVSACLATGPLFAGPQVELKGSCHMGNFDAQDNDIELFDLNLDIEANDNIQHKKCEILTKFPARNGYKLIVSTFKMEAIASINQQGVAIITLRHNFKNWGWKQAEARAVMPGTQDLVVQQQAIGTGDCNEAIQLKTEILTAARNATLLQDSANSNLIDLTYNYQKCR